MSEPENAKRPLRVGLISLGCAKNLVDAEIMLGTLAQAGLELTPDARRADAVIVNTCSFVDSAKQESVDAILESAAVREAHTRGQALIVAGCLPQRFPAELPALLPEVDVFMGVDQLTQVTTVVRQALARRAERLHAGPNGRRPRAARAPQSAPATAAAAVHVEGRPRYIPDYATPRYRLTPPHLAYVKIAEGCNHPCSFCIIPRLRGGHRSRPQADLVQEARRLLAQGVKELNLVSQDSTYYGLDLRPNHSRAIASPERFRWATRALPSGATTLSTLLRELNALAGDFWIRLLYTHPAHWTPELIRTLVECPKVARYVDIPLQHIHDNMLARMRRETTREYIVELLRDLRARLPGLALRTTFIVGFPGETEACFQDLLEFLGAARFERLGVFTYSREEATVAGRMEAQVPEATKRRRWEQAMLAQREVARQLQAAVVGRELKVLVERQLAPGEAPATEGPSLEHGPRRAPAPAPSLGHGPLSVARGEADAPDIDGRVYVRGRLPVGEFARVKVMGHTDYDLLAEPAADGLPADAP